MILGSFWCLGPTHSVCRIVPSKDSLRPSWLVTPCVPRRGSSQQKQSVLGYVIFVIVARQEYICVPSRSPSLENQKT
jgi:hypothetical protein